MGVAVFAAYVSAAVIPDSKPPFVCGTSNRPLWTTWACFSSSRQNQHEQHRYRQHGTVSYSSLSEPPSQEMVNRYMATWCCKQPSYTLWFILLYAINAIRNLIPYFPIYCMSSFSSFLWTYTTYVLKVLSNIDRHLDFGRFCSGINFPSGEESWTAAFSNISIGFSCFVSRSKYFIHTYTEVDEKYLYLWHTHIYTYTH